MIGRRRGFRDSPVGYVRSARTLARSVNSLDRDRPAVTRVIGGVDADAARALS